MKEKANNIKIILKSETWKNLNNRGRKKLTDTFYSNKRAYLINLFPST